MFCAVCIVHSVCLCHAVNEEALFLSQIVLCAVDCKVELSHELSFVYGTIRPGDSKSQVTISHRMK